MKCASAMTSMQYSALHGIRTSDIIVSFQNVLAASDDSLRSQPTRPDSEQTQASISAAKNVSPGTRTRPSWVPANATAAGGGPTPFGNGRERSCFLPCWHSLCVERASRERQQFANRFSGVAGKTRYLPSKEKNLRPTAPHSRWRHEQQACW